jgi:ATP-dependent HslUV protease subunit HslV
MSEATMHGTTILAVRRDGRAALAGDGQVTLGQTAVKHTARKIRRLHNGQVLAGFAGSTADALTLFARLEAKIEEHRGHLDRAAVELAKDWRADKFLRRLEAFVVALDKDSLFLISGAGDVLTPDDDVVAVGSGGPFALAAARALLRHSTLDAPALAQEALKIAASICIYTNEHISVETL